MQIKNLGRTTANTLVPTPPTGTGGSSPSPVADTFESPTPANPVELSANLDGRRPSKATAAQQQQLDTLTATAQVESTRADQATAAAQDAQADPELTNAQRDAAIAAADTAVQAAQLALGAATNYIAQHPGLTAPPEIAALTSDQHADNGKVSSLEAAQLRAAVPPDANGNLDFSDGTTISASQLLSSDSAMAVHNQFLRMNAGVIPYDGTTNTLSAADATMLQNYFANQPSRLPNSFQPGSFIAYGLGVGTGSAPSPATTAFQYNFVPGPESKSGTWNRASNAPTAGTTQIESTATVPTVWNATAGTTLDALSGPYTAAAKLAGTYQTDISKNADGSFNSLTITLQGGQTKTFSSQQAVYNFLISNGSVGSFNALSPTNQAFYAALNDARVTNANFPTTFVSNGNQIISPPFASTVASVDGTGGTVFQGSGQMTSPTQAQALLATIQKTFPGAQLVNDDEATGGPWNTSNIQRWMIVLPGTDNGSGATHPLSIYASQALSLIQNGDGQHNFTVADFGGPTNSTQPLATITVAQLNAALANQPKP